MTIIEKAKNLWDQLGDIPIDKYEDIEEKFLHFEIGTNIHDIWHWFEEEFDLSIHDDLMFQKQ